VPLGTAAAGLQTVTAAGVGERAGAWRWCWAPVRLQPHTTEVPHTTKVALLGSSDSRHRYIVETSLLGVLARCSSQSRW